MRSNAAAAVLLIAAALTACHRDSRNAPRRVTGYVEATDVRVSAEVGGRLTELRVGEGDRVKAGDVIARLDTADTELALRRAEADRDQAAAQLRLLEAGSRPEDIRQASAQLASAQADVKAAQAQLDAASADVTRFENLLRANAGSVKQRDDAVTRRDVAAAQVRAAEQRAQAASDALARVRAGSRPQEIAAGHARVASSRWRHRAVRVPRRRHSAASVGDSPRRHSRPRSATTSRRGVAGRNA